MSNCFQSFTATLLVKEFFWTGGRIPPTIMLSWLADGGNLSHPVTPWGLICPTGRRRNALDATD
jgi:hypothetical protein